MKLILLVVLFIQTENGQVSIQKGLDAKECKMVLNKLKCASSCLCGGVDENGEMFNRKGVTQCGSMTQGSDFKRGECLE